uniref:Lsm14-like N-terminal domain-containing protein n=1 Tax=Plectus sambesii TaxID=2011161 RepID=A0A914XIN4_9BILA
MAAAEHIGALISVECGELGVYQGKILGVNDADQSITLERPFHNGTPHPLPTVTLAAEDMVAVKILKLPGEFAAPNLIAAPRVRTVRPQVPQPAVYASANRAVRPQRMPKCAASLVQSSSGVPSQPRPPRMDGLGFIAISQNASSSNIQQLQQQQQPPNKSPSGRKPVSASLSLSRGPPAKGSFTDRGPCGIPELDSKEPVRVSNRNRDLGDAIDRDLMQTDFDFEANLALFDKNQYCNSSDDGMNGAPVKSKNFRHDENIVGDPDRVYSWTKTTSNGRSHAGIEPLTSCIQSSTEIMTVDGVSMPAVSAEDKVRLMAEAEQQFGVDVVVAVVADRFSQCIFEEIERSAVMVSTAVVLISGDAVASRIAARVASHLANRRCDTVVYGFNGVAPVDHASVRFATSAGQMPTARDVQLVISVCDWAKFGQRLNTPRWLRSWLTSLSSSACVLSLDSTLPLSSSDPPRQVVVMVTCPTDGADRQGDDALVIDIGLPFDFIDQSDALASAFGTKFVVQLC